MSRSKTRRLSLALIAAASVAVGVAAPAAADRGGEPHAGSCGLGRAGSEALRANPARPGAGDVILIPLGDCPGPGGTNPGT